MKVKNNIPSGVLEAATNLLKPAVDGLDNSKLIAALKAYDPDRKRPLMKPSEVAAILNVTSQTVYNYIQAKELPAVQIGCSWRISADDLDKYLERQKKRGQQEPVA